jgi:pyruvate dehydrogenase E1 component beta subunit
MKNTTLSYSEGLYNAMHDALASHDHTLIIGQGVTDHKGIFGTTTGLGEKFGEDRVLDTPLAEESITGICIGAALNGLYPINTHIRADFSLLAFNQIINLAAKYKYMFGGLFDLPMMIRLVVGRSWGQGAQHSQSLQSLFAHIPGLMVIMPSSPHSIEAAYGYAIANHRGPVISLEHRLMYELKFSDDGWSSATGETPFSSRMVRSGSDVTIVATSIMVLEAMRAAEYLSGHGIDCEVIDLHCVSHPDKQMIIDSVGRTGRLIVADTSWLPYGVAAEIGRIIVEHDPSLLRAPMISMGMQPSPCPTAKSLEDIFYPTVGDLCGNVVRLVKGPNGANIPMPSETSMSDYYKAFRGPF